nr:cytochrome P450 CYP410E1 [Dendroctonus rhizophagus]
MSLTCILLGFLILFYIRFLLINWRIIKFSWHNRGFFLPVLPFVGSGYVAFLTGKRPNLLGMSHWLKHHFGAPLNLWLGHQYHYIPLDAEEIRTVLTHPRCFNKALVYKDVENVFGKSSLVFIPYEEWKQRRKHFIKGFKPNILKGFIGLIEANVCKLVEAIRTMENNSVPFERFYSFTFNTFYVTALGLDGSKFKEELIEFAALREKIEEAVSQKVLNPFVPFYVWQRLFPRGRKTMKYMERCRVILSRVIKEKKAQIENNHAYIENSNEVPLLDLIMSYKSEIMTDEQIYQETVLFTSAAIETSAYVLFLGFTLLGMHPEVQENIYNEVQLEIGDNELCSSNMKNLKYTEAVLMEILRLIPPVPAVGRFVGDDVPLSKNKILPKGVDFVAVIHHLHREPKYWKNPDQFDPTRFLPENIHKIVPGSYIPFSIGARDCIGKHYAMIVLKIAYANVLRHFRIATNHKSIEDFELCSAITVFTSKPIDLRFSPRTK